MSVTVVTHHRFSGHDLSVNEQQAIRRTLEAKMRVLEITPLSKEALVLCERLSRAYHADLRKRNILGRPSGDEAYQRKNRRIWRIACDRWRRRRRGFKPLEET